MNFSRFDPSYAQYTRCSELCPEGTYQTISPSSLSGIIPDALLSKVNHVVALGSAGSGFSVFVFNLSRVDLPASALDQEPHIAAFDHSGSAASGGFVHHGDWPGRATHPGSAFMQAISACGITAYYPFATIPSSPSGKLEDLEGESSHRQAFWTALSALQETR